MKNIYTLEVEGKTRQVFSNKEKAIKALSDWLVEYCDIHLTETQTGDLIRDLIQKDYCYFEECMKISISIQKFQVL